MRYFYIFIVLLCSSLSSSWPSKFHPKNLCSKPAIRSFQLISSVATAFTLLYNQPVYAEPPPLPDQCTSTSNPSATIITCRRLGLKDERLLGCLSSENCFSTSAKSTRYLSPLVYNTNTPEDALEILKVSAQSQGLTILRLDNDKHYLLAAEKDVPKQVGLSYICYVLIAYCVCKTCCILYKCIIVYM